MPKEEKLMRTIHKKIVMDEARNPIAVQIDYEDWLEIERLLKMQRPEEKPTENQQDDFEVLADKLGEAWQGGDGLEYQTRLREEWEDR
jgi:hypothetical protein